MIIRPERLLRLAPPERCDTYLRSRKNVVVGRPSLFYHIRKGRRKAALGVESHCPAGFGRQVLPYYPQATTSKTVLTNVYMRVQQQTFFRNDSDYRTRQTRSWYPHCTRQHTDHEGANLCVHQECAARNQDKPGSPGTSPLSPPKNGKRRECASP